MESQTDQLSTTVVEGTVETVTALAEEIQAAGGRIVRRAGPGAGGIG